MKMLAQQLRLRFVNIVVVLAAIIIGALTTISPPVAAAPNEGPDQNNISYTNYYGASYNSSLARQFMYVVARNPYADITSTRLKVYLPSPTGSVTIRDPHMCTNRIFRSSSTYSYYSSGDVVYTTSSGTVTSYRFTNTSGTGSTLYGSWDSSSTCENKTLVFNLSGSTLDPDTGLYPYFLQVSALAAGQYSNLYALTAPTGAYISQDANQSSQGYALHQNSPVPTISNPDTPTPPHPFQNYANWELPFGPDCTVTTPTVRDYVELYDDDNYQNYEAQGQPFWIQMREYDRSGNFMGTIRPYGIRWTDWSGAFGPTNTTPTTDWDGGWQTKTYAGSTYDYIYTTADKQSLRAYYDFKRDKVYRLFLFNVFYYNKMQFQLPWESVFYYRQCGGAQATLQPSSTVDKASITYPETATFRHYLNVSDYSSNSSVNYSIQRYRNGVAVGGAQTGASNYSSNGQILIATNPYTSSAGDLGARICERLTLSGTGTFTNNPSEACTTVVSRPYLEAGNNDIWAGARFDYSSNRCSGAATRSSTISSWVSSGAGAFSEYGLFALGGITEFGSGRQPGGNGLTFANTPGLGSYGSPLRCTPNYAGIDMTGAASWPGMASLPSNAGKRKYTVTGNVTIGAGTVPVGTQALLRVNGNVTISGNIGYANSYGSSDDISSLWIVATGNIYIQENVSSLSGLYVAQGTSGAPGKLHTCVRSGFTSTYNPLTTTGCNTPLSVYGALIADQVYWQRTSGSAAPGQSAAESIQFDPGLYLNSPLGSTTASSLSTQDSTELPPIY